MWTSRTGCFDPRELASLESMSSGELASKLLASDPLVALRGLAEVMLNDDTAKLDALLAYAPLCDHWKLYALDPEVDMSDHQCARKLRDRLG